MSVTLWLNGVTVLNPFASNDPPAATVIVIVCEIVLLLVVSLATIVALYDPGVEDICPPKSPVV